MSHLRPQLLLLGLFLLSKESSSLKSMVIKVPEAVRAGDSVTLSCQYDLEDVALYSIKWYWNEEEFYRYIPKDLPPYKSFPMRFINVDLSTSGEQNVTLRHVQRQLTGDYKCEVSSDGPLFHTEIRVAHLIVADLPLDDPVLNIRDTKVEVGKPIRLECTQSGSHPAANISWFINNKQVSDNSDFISIQATEVGRDEGDLQSARSRISILTNKSHFNQSAMTIRCEASIYKIWKRSVESTIRDDSPKLAQVLGSTLSQSQKDPILEPANSAPWTTRHAHWTVLLGLVCATVACR
ncbi:uncharacterized protein LOC125503136 [Dendroctonus ponderosae]|uniref:uncharacterized protein LOC125503136 n=1 Tax=Dendroctonus ponderosae TaxID=77166 RepID=UPI0020352ADC|nr:uncharacterized protein LOC125503136 [Dendroctonus ponderosae]